MTSKPNYSIGRRHALSDPYHSIHITEQELQDTSPLAHISITPRIAQLLYKHKINI